MDEKKKVGLFQTVDSSACADALLAGLRWGRKNLGLSQQALGVEIKRSRNWVVNMESGKSLLRMSEIGKLLDFYGIDVVLVDRESSRVVGGVLSTEKVKPNYEVLKNVAIEADKSVDGLFSEVLVRRSEANRNRRWNKEHDEAIAKKKEEENNEQTPG